MIFTRVIGRGFCVELCFTDKVPRSDKVTIYRVRYVLAVAAGSGTLLEERIELLFHVGAINDIIQFILGNDSILLHLLKLFIQSRYPNLGLELLNVVVMNGTACIALVSAHLFDIGHNIFNGNRMMFLE